MSLKDKLATQVAEKAGIGAEKAAKGLDVAGKVLSYGQRKMLGTIAEKLTGQKPDVSESSEAASQAITEKAADVVAPYLRPTVEKVFGKEATDVAANVAKAGTVAGLEVFADPLSLIPVSKLGKMAKVVSGGIARENKLVKAAEKVAEMAPKVAEAAPKLETEIAKAVDIAKPDIYKKAREAGGLATTTEQVAELKKANPGKMREMTISDVDKASKQGKISETLGNINIKIDPNKTAKEVLKRTPTAPAYKVPASKIIKSRP